MKIDLLCEMIVELADYCREHEMEIPTSNVVEAIEIIPKINFSLKEEVKITLKQLWIKEKRMNEKFEECFEEFFYNQVLYRFSSRVDRKQKKEFEEVLEQTGMTEGYSFESEDGWLFEKLEEKAANGTLAAELFLGEVKGSNFLDLDKFKEKIEEMNEKEIKRIAEDLAWEAVSSGQPTIIFDAIAGSLEKLLGLKKEVLKIKTETLTELSGAEKTMFSGMRKMISTMHDELQNREIVTLNKNEIASLRDGIEENAHIFLTKFVKILKGKNRSEEVDVEKTITESISRQGIPMEIFFKKPKIKKTKIEVILDVSGSVVKSAEFLTLFAYLLHKRFPEQVKVYPFVGMLRDATEFFETDDVDNAVESVLKRTKIDYRGYSDYGRAFREYYEMYAANGRIDESTIILILGDARNNRNESGEIFLEKMKRESRNLVWFNTEEKAKWGKGDSYMPLYQKYSDYTAEMTTMKKFIVEMERIADVIENKRM